MKIFVCKTVKRLCYQSFLIVIAYCPHYTWKLMEKQAICMYLHKESFMF